MPGTPTTKYGLPTIAGTDLISGIDDWSVAAMGALDPLLAPSDQGTLAARPVSTIPSPSGKAGRTYYATDTNQLFRDTGTGWTELVVAGTTPPAVGVPAHQAWQTVAPSLGTWSAPLAYMKDALGFVHFRGDDMTLSGSSITNGFVFVTMPVGYRPGMNDKRIMAWNAGTPNTTLLKIDSNGEIRTQNGLTAAVVLSFSGITYLAEN